MMKASHISKDYLQSAFSSCVLLASFSAHHTWYRNCWWNSIPYLLPLILLNWPYHWSIYYLILQFTYTVYTKYGPSSESFNASDIVVLLAPVHLVLSRLSVYAIHKFVRNNCSTSIYVPLDSEVLEFFEPAISGAKSYVIIIHWNSTLNYTV